jgi:hypothetical protein
MDVKTVKTQECGSINNEGGEVVPSKRSSLKAAWVAPLIVAVSLPRSSYAANISGTPRQGKPEYDKGHDKGHHKGHHKGHDKSA